MISNGDKIKEAWNNLTKLLPKWAKDKANLFLLADQELVIHQAKEKEVHIKKDRCVQCGECCLNIPDNFTPFGTNGEGRCNALDENYSCSAGGNKPFKCLADPLKTNIPNCSIRYF